MNLTAIWISSIWIIIRTDCIFLQNLIQPDYSRELINFLINDPYNFREYLDFFQFLVYTVYVLSETDLKLNRSHKFECIYSNSFQTIWGLYAVIADFPQLHGADIYNSRIKGAPWVRLRAYYWLTMKKIFATSSQFT